MELTHFQKDVLLALWAYQLNGNIPTHEHVRNMLRTKHISPLPLNTGFNHVVKLQDDRLLKDVGAAITTLTNRGMISITPPGFEALETRPTYGFYSDKPTYGFSQAAVSAIIPELSRMAHGQKPL